VIGADDQDGIVARQGTDYVAPVLMIDGESHGLGGAAGGVKDELVLGLANREPEAGEHLIDGGLIVFLFDGHRTVAVGDGVAAGTFVEAELMDVAREGGLGDIEAAPDEFAPQFVLAADCLGGDQLANCGVPFLFAHENPRLAVR